jgi:hypothetical protein
MVLVVFCCERRLLETGALLYFARSQFFVRIVSNDIWEYSAANLGQFGNF